jgi:hypothetical protein
VEFFVLGRDHDDFEGHSDELNERHWSYLDGAADRLVARGPTLDGEGEHTGSVHIVRLADHATAVAFAHDEPYWLAGLYATLEVVPFRNLLGATMWQRERLPGVAPSWLACSRWPVPCAPPEVELERAARALRADRSLVFCGLLLDLTATGAIGLVAGFDAPVPVLPAAVAALDELVGGTPHEATVERWQRGGRSQ